MRNAPRRDWTLSPRGFLLFLFFACASTSCAEDPAHAGSTPVGWRRLFSEPPSDSWIVAGDAALDRDRPRKLSAAAGIGTLISTKRGAKRERNLESSQVYGDIELKLEFMLAKRSNGGVKLQGLYEIQLFDSHGVAEPDATHCGGIYPRAVRKPTYHHIDKGTPPIKNAAKPAGQWQSLLIRFRAPRFNDEGVKIEPALFEEVRLNGEVVQRMQTVNAPTGAYWHRPEVSEGPVYLQGDHGSVAYRNVLIRPLAAQPEPEP